MFISNKGTIKILVAVNLEIFYFTIILDEFTRFTNITKLYRFKIFTKQGFIFSIFLRRQKQCRRISNFILYTPTIFYTTIENIVANAGNIGIIIHYTSVSGGRTPIVNQRLGNNISRPRKSFISIVGS